MVDKDTFCIDIRLVLKFIALVQTLNSQFNESDGFTFTIQWAQSGPCVSSENFRGVSPENYEMKVFHLKIKKVQPQMIARIEFHLFISVAKLKICFTFCQ